MAFQPSVHDKEGMLLLLLLLLLLFIIILPLGFLLKVLDTVKDNSVLSKRDSF